MNPYESCSVEEIEAWIRYYSSLEQYYEILAVEARAERRVARGQLAPARHRAKVAAAADQVKRPRGRPVNPNALSGPERLRLYKERRAQRELEALLGNTKPQ